MDEQQLLVFESMRAGRLIFPQRPEMVDLQGMQKNGGLTSYEAERLGLLERVHKEIAAADREFHEAMSRGDYEKALPIAEAVLAIIKGVP